MTTICQNRKARHHYKILDTLEAGIVLKGTEIKSVRKRHVSLDGAYIRVVKGNVVLIDCNIEPYKESSHYFNHEPKRERRLLMRRREIRNFASRAKEKGLTLIPLSMYLKGGRAKIEVALCRGKQVHDKRQDLKERDAQREIRET